MEKAILTCRNEKVKNINDAMRQIEDYVRGSIMYTDLKLLGEHVNKLIKEGEKNGFKVYHLKNKLKSGISNISINLSLNNITTEI